MIQKKVVPIINKGIDIIGASKSGTGKTASYVWPILEKLRKSIKPNHRVVRAVIVVPTKELVDQVSVSFANYGKYLKIKHTKIYGGSTKQQQVQKIESGIDIVVATPGRLKDMVKEELLDISSVNMLVVDEADTMLELGFLEDIEFIMDNTSKHKQIMMFSATISQNIQKLGKKYLHNPVSVTVSQRRDVVTLIKHRAFKVDKKRKTELLAHLLKKYKTKQVLVFVNMKEDIDTVTSYLVKNNINAVSLHGDIDFKIRTNNIKQFRAGKVQVLVATDIAGRGIDIKNLPLVINYELPEATDEFTHRVGRTGRANNRGEVISLLTVSDYNRFTKIERDLKLSIKREVAEGFELKDRQPRQKQQVKKSLSEKKGLKTMKIKQDDKIKKVKSKKTTKRDSNRVFRRG
jgi:ATP-dependent RNA helicase RhlE